MGLWVFRQAFLTQFSMKFRPNLIRTRRNFVMQNHVCATE